jgi:hypothetical protein
LEFRDSWVPLGSPGTKSHLDVAPMESYRIYYKGEGGGFSQVRAMASLVCSNCPWLVLALKMFQLCTNHFVLVLCKFVWVSEACHFVLIPSRSSNTPFYPSIVLRAREHALTLCPSIVFNLGFTFESLKKLGVCQLIPWCIIPPNFTFAWNLGPNVEGQNISRKKKG